MPNSVYYTLPRLIGEPGSAPWRFTRAIQRATDWMKTTTAPTAPNCSPVTGRSSRSRS